MYIHICIRKLKIIIIHESVSHAIQSVTFSVSNLFQQQHSKVIQSTKRLKSAIESTGKADLLFIY